MSDHFEAAAKEARDERPLALEAYKGMIRPAYDDPLFLQALKQPEELWKHPGATMLLGRGNRVGIISFPFSGGTVKDIVVKEFSSRGVNKLKSLFLPSKAAKAWRGALALKQRGLETASPVAYFEKRKAGFVERNFFLAERIDGAMEIRELFRRLSLAELEPLLASLAGFIYRCHQRGILHRDLSDGNVLVKREEGGNFVFYLLDTDRVRVRRKISGLARVKNLIRLGIPPLLQKPFLKSYFGEKPLEASFWRWYKMNKAIYTGYVELKRKLRLRQIARKLGVQ
jgi:serine/threonine protein kinase